MRFAPLLVIAAAVVGAAAVPAHAQSLDTYLYLDPLPSSAAAGDTILFYGWLEDDEGYAVPYATIYIKDDVDFGPDKTMATVITGEDGTFLAEWTAVPRRAGGEWDIYAVFEGESDLRKSRSDTYSVFVARDRAPQPDPPAALPRSTLLSLDPLPASAFEGSALTFTGRLATSDGFPVAGALVEIKEDDPLLPDETIESALTGADGRFFVSWTAEQGIIEEVLDVYAEYDGDGTYGKSTTARQQIEILSAPDETTSITLDALPGSVHIGDEIEFTGRLTSGGVPLAGALVEIYEDDPLFPDQRIGGALTGADGRFAVPWTASVGLEKDLDMYAEFAAAGGYGKSQTQRQQMSVLRYGGDIRLDYLPPSVVAGDVVMFRGTLDLESHSPEGAKVYIMDEDTLSPDDLLAAAYVEADGRFAANWFANRMDANDEVEVYAVFEGGGRFYRQTTCDEGPTSDTGGKCANTVPLEVRGALRESSSEGDGWGDGAYVEMFYSMDIDRPPLVAIAPSPDQSGHSMRYIVPVQEGILTWKSSMEQRYGGDWDVEFVVVEPGVPFFKERPDVVVNLVSHEQDAGCEVEYGGWAQIYAEPPRPAPVQTIVCVAGPRGDVTGPRAAAVAAHEFIHAVGLGHAFNKVGDMMCSIEDGMPTCPSLESKATIPSDLNAAAVASLYGVDGFANPNYPVAYKSRLYDGEPFEAARLPSDPGGSGNPPQPIPGVESPRPGPEVGAGGEAVAIPSWIKTSAGWWADGMISDDEFARGIEYLIGSGTISVPSAGTSGVDTGPAEIPPWIKTSAGWWADGMISDDEFARGIEYLVSVGAIRT